VISLHVPVTHGATSTSPERSAGAVRVRFGRCRRWIRHVRILGSGRGVAVPERVRHASPGKRRAPVRRSSSAASPAARARTRRPTCGRHARGWVTAEAVGALEPDVVGR